MSCHSGPRGVVLLAMAVAAAVVIAGVAAEQVILVAGGEGRRDVEVLMSDGRNTTDDCKGLADAPFVTRGAVGLVDSQGRPMLCGGGCNPDPKSCHVYNVTTNSWMPSAPSVKLQKARDLAAVVKVPDGNFWIFGGRQGRSTERFNPYSDTFRPGPRLPSEAKGLFLCAAPSATRNAAYISASNGPFGGNLFFEFDASAETFTRLNDSSTRRIYHTCGVTKSYDYYGNAYDSFVVAGGFERFHSPSEGYESYHFSFGNWSFTSWNTLSNHGSASLQLGPTDFLSIGGRVSSAMRVAVRDVRKNLYFGPNGLNSTRAFPVAILADRDKVCPN